MAPITWSAPVSSVTGNVAMSTSSRLASWNAADFRSLGMFRILPESDSLKVDRSAAHEIEGRPLPRAGVRNLAPLSVNLGAICLQRHRGARTAFADLVGQAVQAPQDLGLACFPQPPAGLPDHGEGVDPAGRQLR